MYDRTNKTSICSIVFLDIIDYSKKSDADQIEVKNQFNDLINLSLKGVALNDRIILDTGDGAAIAHMGSPEDAMFVALTIRDGILKSNLHSPTPLYVRFGLNLGPVRIVSDINGQPNIIGDGINVAQRIMSFAQPNQILVSRSYYEVTSRLTLEFSEMFDYSGIKHDKHVREHEVYSVRSHKDSAENISKPIAAKDDRRVSHRLVITKTAHLKYALVALPAIIALVMLIKAASDNSVPAIVLAQPSVAPAPSAIVASPIKSNDASLPSNQANKSSIVETTNALEAANNNQAALKLEKKLDENSGQDKQVITALAKTKQAKKEANKKQSNKKTKQQETNKMPPEFVQARATNDQVLANKPKEAAVKPTVKVAKVAELSVERPETKKKSGWSAFRESVKQGGETKCTQAQISMNQCS